MSNFVHLNNSTKMKKVLVAAAFAALFFAQGAKAQTNFQTFYDKFDKSYSQAFDAAGQSIAADCTDQFTRTNKVFAIGVDVDF